MTTAKCANLTSGLDAAHVAAHATGYAHPAYAQSLAEFGRPITLPASGATLLCRTIRNTGRADAMAPYPLLCCPDWTALAEDMDRLASDAHLLSAVAVTDPFCPLSEQQMAAAFPDLCRRFKEHHVVDLAEEPSSFIDRHHARNIRYAAKRIDVEHGAGTHDHLDGWCDLYACLVERHGIEGIARFSQESFARQFDVPGLTAFRACQGGRTVGMTLWFVQGDRAYYHLGAYSQAGYDSKASFAIFADVIEHFRRDGVRWLSLGAGAGASGDGDDGLNRFKRGWANAIRPAYLCGRVLDRSAYLALSGPGCSEYFPAYRRGEFA
ncbi:MAG: GNAT family N-acetyltransferase [Planctomycetes bacterium]|jgi:hypothetical protein|nr:GNAT family N-acetyltransferase [Phycisphaerae bacterium]NBB96415.1 GNAT family N-acetyltransferase [Planctomycetota bacterium]